MPKTHYDWFPSPGEQPRRRQWRIEVGLLVMMLLWAALAWLFLR